MRVYDALTEDRDSECKEGKEKRNQLYKLGHRNREEARDRHTG